MFINQTYQHREAFSYGTRYNEKKNKGKKKRDVYKPKLKLQVEPRI